MYHADLHECTFAEVCGGVPWAGIAAGEVVTRVSHQQAAGEGAAVARGAREAFQDILDAVAAGRLAFPADRVYDGLEQVPQSHDDMEHDRATGKLVVRLRH